MEALVLWHRTAPSAHDDDADPAAELAWIRRVRNRVEGASVTTIGPIGGSLVAIFHSEDYARAIELALGLMSEAEKSPDFAQPPRIAFGAAIGELDFLPVSEGGRVEYVGSAINRAQLLANRARAGEIVVDGRAREVAQHTYLFLRAVGTGEASLRGHALDREEPRIADCRRHFVHLGRPPTPPRVTEAFAPLRAIAETPGTRTVVIRGRSGSGARRCVAEAEFTARPSVSIRCVGIPGGLEPLGSLRAGLIRTFGPGAARASRIDGLDLDAADAIGRIGRGEAIDFDRAAEAISAMLVAAAKQQGKRPWIIVEPAHEVDESTLEMVARLAHDPRVDVLVLVHVRVDDKLPAPLDRDTPHHTIDVPTLRPDDVSSMVGKMLREASGEEIAKQVAQTRADSPLAVVECLRAWIASGDVVRRGRSFVFRIGPRTGDAHFGYDDWVSERIALLDDRGSRLLELLALAPPTLPPSDLEALALADGIEPASLEKTLTRLREDRFVVASPTVDLDNLPLRDVVIGRMSPARRAELAGAIAARVGQTPGFGRATAGHFLVDAGASSQAADTLLETAELAASNGHPRASIRLAAAAVHASPTPATRSRAAAVMRGVTVRVPSTSADEIPTGRYSLEVPAESVTSPASVVVAAVRAGDFDRVARIVDLAIAEGAPLAAADRWRGVIALLRGDTATASSAIARSRERAREATSAALRTEVAAALVAMQEGHPGDALRKLMSALADARARRDSEAERATLRVLALCSRELGREAESAKLLAASASIQPAGSAAAG